MLSYPRLRPSVTLVVSQSYIPLSKKAFTLPQRLVQGPPKQRKKLTDQTKTDCTHSADTRTARPSRERSMSIFLHSWALGNFTAQQQYGNNHTREAHFYVDSTPSPCCYVICQDITGSILGSFGMKIKHLPPSAGSRVRKSLLALASLLLYDKKSAPIPTPMTIPNTQYSLHSPGNGEKQPSVHALLALSQGIDWGRTKAGCQLQEPFAEPKTCSSQASEGFRKEGT